MAAQGVPMSQGSVALPEFLNVQDPSGKYLIKHQGSFAVVEVKINPKDTFKAETGAMITMPKEVDLSATMEGNCCTACCRCCFAGSSCCYSHYSVSEEGAAKRNGVADVLVSPKLPGDALFLELKSGDSWICQRASYVCSDVQVNVGTHCTTCAQGCCGGEGFFLLKMDGEGRLILSSYGSILRYDLKAGESRIIDNGNLVAWNANMGFSVQLASTCWNSLTSGEGFVTKFTGPGTVYCQTRTTQGLAEVLLPYFNRIGGK